MKFVVHAQLPKRLARWLLARGHDAPHTGDLSAQNRTQDADMTALAFRVQRIVVSKDADFVDSFLIQRRPSKLLPITIGNIGNQAQMHLLERNIREIKNALDNSDFIELTINHHIAPD
jgi:predicted nuclease of predicted toxin-antitoxin system